MLGKNSNIDHKFGQKSKYWSQILSKIEILVKNQNIFFSKIETLHKHCDKKLELFVKKINVIKNQFFTQNSRKK